MPSSSKKVIGNGNRLVAKNRLPNREQLRFGLIPWGDECRAGREFGGFRGSRRARSTLPTGVSGRLVMNMNCAGIMY